MEPYAHLKTAQELREEGNREFKGGYYDAAAAKYRAALRKDNNWALLHCNLALCFAKQEKWDEALAAFRAAVDINPEMSKAWLSIAGAECVVRIERVLEVFQP